MTVAEAALAVRAAQGELSLPEVSDLTGFSLAEIALVQSTMQKAATMLDVAMLLYLARRNGLDPVAGQIRWIIRQGKGVPQVGIDGQRLIAARTNQYAGSEDIVYRGALEVSRGKDRYGKDLGVVKVPESAEACVWRIVGGFKNPFRATVRWTEFYPGAGDQGFMWRDKPYHMLGKCAEAQALRKGFPAEMTGIEFSPTEGEQPGPVQVVDVADLADRQRRMSEEWFDDEGPARPSLDEAVAAAASQSVESAEEHGVTPAATGETPGVTEDTRPDAPETAQDEAQPASPHWAQWEDTEAWMTALWGEIEQANREFDNPTRAAPSDKIRQVAEAIGGAVGGDIDGGRLVVTTLTKGRAQLTKQLNVAEVWAILNHTADTAPMSFAERCREIIRWRQATESSN